MAVSYCLPRRRLSSVPDGAVLQQSLPASEPSRAFCVFTLIETGWFTRPLEATMPVVLWLLGVPLVVIVALSLLHVV